MQTTATAAIATNPFDLSSFVDMYKPRKFEIRGILFTGHKVDSPRIIERAFQSDGTYKQEPMYFVIGRSGVFAGNNFGHWRFRTDAGINFVFFGETTTIAHKIPRGYYPMMDVRAGQIYIAEFLIPVSLTKG